MLHSQTVAAEVISPACQTAAIEFKNRFELLEKRYSRISSLPVREENKPSWSWGSKKEAVYLLHGFIGTPEEMSGVANLLKQQNYNVINDIIPGYGSDGLVANAFNQNVWQDYLNANMKSVRSCFKKIHMVGFSTGGLLVHQYVRKNVDNFAAASVVLYSPYYKADLSYIGFIGSAARFLTSVVSTRALYELTRFSDIRVAVLKPENYLQQIPLDAANEVESLGTKVDSEIKKSPLHAATPALLYVSDGDRIIDQKITLQNVSADFPSVKIMHFKNADVPHHLMVKEVSPVAAKVLQQTTEFILSN